MNCAQNFLLVHDLYNKYILSITGFQQFHLLHSRSSQNVLVKVLLGLKGALDIGILFRYINSPFPVFDSQRTESNKKKIIPHLNVCTDLRSARFSLVEPREFIL